MCFETVTNPQYNFYMLLFELLLSFTSYIRSCNAQYLINIFFLNAQAWTNMVLTILNQVQLLPDATFVALQPAMFPCISQMTCHVTDHRVRQAVREWLGRVGRVYDIIL